VIDIRVDDSKTPLVALRHLLNLYEAGQLITEANRQLTTGDAPAALRTATTARDKVPENDNAWVALANIHLKAGRKADALAAIAKAIEINAANKRQIPKNRNFESLLDDAEFKRLTRD
jgi:Flp pilus assembly protein TadD